MEKKIKLKIQPRKRLNPKTKKPYKIGEYIGNGKYFREYRKYPDKSNEEYFMEWHFASKEHMLRGRLHILVGNLKIRAKNKAVPFDIDTDYLQKLFPGDWKCPVLGVELIWGGERNNSPSLDRILPEMGYVRGNVRFMSDRANRVLNNATLEDLKKVSEYLKKIKASGE